MGGSGQCHTLAALYPWKRTPVIHWVGGWVGFRTDLDTEARGKFLCLCRWSNPGWPVCSQTLYWLSYPKKIQSLGEGYKTKSKNNISTHTNTENSMHELNGGCNAHRNVSFIWSVITTQAKIYKPRKEEYLYRLVKCLIMRHVVKNCSSSYLFALCYVWLYLCVCACIILLCLAL
jgi:hypothetical protein